MTDRSSKADIFGTFTKFEDVMAAASALSKRFVFGLARDTKNFTKEQFKQTFGEVEYSAVVRRGYLYCSDCGKPDTGRVHNVR